MIKDPDKIASLAHDRGVEWADKEAIAQGLEEVRATLFNQLDNLEARTLSLLVVEYIGSGCGIGEAERRAKADQRWLAAVEDTKTKKQMHVEGMVEARRRANIALVKWKVAQQYGEFYRTVQATERAQMKIL